MSDNDKLPDWMTDDSKKPSWVDCRNGHHYFVETGNTEMTDDEDDYGRPIMVEATVLKCRYCHKYVLDY